MSWTSPNTPSTLAASPFRMRLIMLDFDGTLSPIAPTPAAAAPKREVLETLKALCADPRNRVFVISGRDQACLDEWLGSVPGLGLSAEHGCFLKYPFDARGWLDLTEELGLGDGAWKSEVVDIFNYYTERTQGSFIEHKRSSVTWHYRLADPSYGAFQAKECQNHLENAILSKYPLEILVGKKNLEVRPQAVNKGEIVKRLLATSGPPGARFDFIFCAGDDRTDEDMFRVLKREFPITPALASNGTNGSTTPNMGGATPTFKPQLDTAAPTALPPSPRSALSAPADLATNGDAVQDQPKVWSVTIGPATKRTLADWHLPSPHHLVEVLQAWVGLPTIGLGEQPTTPQNASPRPTTPGASHHQMSLHQRLIAGMNRDLISDEAVASN